MMRSPSTTPPSRPMSPPGKLPTPPMSPPSTPTSRPCTPPSRPRTCTNPSSAEVGLTRRDHIHPQSTSGLIAHAIRPVLIASSLEIPSFASEWTRQTEDLFKANHLDQQLALPRPVEFTEKHALPRPQHQL